MELALRNQGKDPVAVVKEKAAKYVNAFLNSSGGVLLFGINDDGIVERVPIYGAPKKPPPPAEGVAKPKSKFPLTAKVQFFIRCAEQQLNLNSLQPSH